MSKQRTAEEDVENELWLDRMIYGTSYHKIVDGRKVRIAPQDVYWKPRWYSRLWWRLRSFFRGW